MLMAKKSIYLLTEKGAEEIELFIAASKITQREFSEKINVSPSYVSQVLTRKIKVTARVAYKITDGINKKNPRDLFEICTENEK
ncbi:hypothetical protein BSSX_p0021 (plasmid) [Bacillus subtilis]|nr:hypothetical protein BSSX_p0021 [Bacillus subtilis]